MFFTQTYSKTTSMVPYKHMEHMRETIRALNVLYVYDRSYEPYLVQWLFPMQLAFRDRQAMSDDVGESSLTADFHSLLHREKNVILMNEKLQRKTQLYCGLCHCDKHVIFCIAMA